MKTITITDESYDFLVNLAREINSQDNRATRSPYYFQVQEDKENYVPEGCGEYNVWILDGEFKIRTEGEIKEAIFCHNDWDFENDEHQKEYDKLDGGDIDDILENAGYSKFDAILEHKYSNCFFTEKAFNEYLKSDKHNLNNQKSFLFHAWRNKERSKSCQQTL